MALARQVEEPSTASDSDFMPISLYGNFTLRTGHRIDGRDVTLGPKAAIESRGISNRE
jgi:hypothetical protein